MQVESLSSFTKTFTGECKFTLQMRKGGVVRVYDSVLMEESRYKCLLVSENTTAEEVRDVTEY